MGNSHKTYQKIDKLLINNNDKLDIEFDDESIIKYVENNNLELMKKECKKIKFDTNKIYFLCSKLKRFKFMDFLSKTYRIDTKTIREIFKESCYNGDLDTAKYIYKRESHRLKTRYNRYIYINIFKKCNNGDIILWLDKIVKIPFEYKINKIKEVISRHNWMLFKTLISLVNTMDLFDLIVESSFIWIRNKNYDMLEFGCKYSRERRLGCLPTSILKIEGFRLLKDSCRDDKLENILWKNASNACILKYLKKFCIDGNLEQAQKIYKISPISIPDVLFYDSPNHVIDWLETLPRNKYFCF